MLRYQSISHVGCVRQRENMLIRFLFTVWFLAVLFGISEAQDVESNLATVHLKYARQDNADSVYIEWIRHYAGPDSFSVLTGLVVDNLGNVYMTGFSPRESAIIKYNSNGVALWVVRYHSSEIRAGSICVDNFGNVYMAGTANAELSSDYITIKYNSSGKEEWTARYNGPDSLGDFATGIAIDSAGNIYLTGVSGSLGTYTDYATVKYNSLGVQQWVARYNGPGVVLSRDLASYIAIDDLGNIYVTGLSYGADGSSDRATIKYNTNGVEEWVGRYVGRRISDDTSPSDLAVDNLGNVYVTGLIGAGGSTEYATVKYNAQGIEKWVSYFGKIGNTSDPRGGLVLDKSGNLYVTGLSEVYDRFGDYLTVKYNTTDGVEQWNTRYNGLGNVSDVATSIAADNSGYIYVTGYSFVYSQTTANFNADFTTLKYDSDGKQMWITSHNGPQNSQDFPDLVTVDKRGNVYIAGRSEFNGRMIVTLIKYKQSRTVGIRDKENILTKFSLSQNYPNPFNPSTTIQYSIAMSGHVTIKIFNLQGQEITTLVNEKKQAGEHEVHWNPVDLPSGVYLYHLQTEYFVETKKLVLLR